MAKDVIDLEVPLIGQKNSAVCWHASYKMMYAWRGRPTKEVDRRWPNPGVKGSDTEDGLKPSQWRLAGSKMSMTGVDATGLKSIDAILNILDMWGPLWTTGKFLSGHMHTIVIGGARRNNKKLLICDPWEIYKTGETTWTHISWWEKLVDNRVWSCQTWGGA